MTNFSNIRQELLDWTMETAAGGETENLFLYSLRNCFFMLRLQKLKEH